MGMKNTFNRAVYSINHEARVDKKAMATYHMVKYMMFPIMLGLYLILYVLGDISTNTVIFAIGSSVVIFPLAIEGLNIISNILYGMYGPAQGLLFSAIIGVIALGIFSFPMADMIPFFGVFGGASLVASILGFIYIILPNDPFLDLPLGFVFLWLMCFILVSIGVV